MLTLVDIEALAVSGKLGAFLEREGIPDFKQNTSEPKTRKFGERQPFDRATFDVELYTAEISRNLARHVEEQ